MTKLFGAISGVSAGSLNQADYAGTTGPDTYTGGDAADSLQGNDGDDVLSGGLGNDTVLGDGGNDSLAGGAGDDLLSGGEGNDTLWSEAGLDSIDGGAGDDIVNWLRSDSAAAVLNGGAGTDTLRYIAGTISGTFTGFEVLDSGWNLVQATTGFLNGFTTLLGYDFVLTDGGSINVSYRSDYVRMSATGGAVNIVGSSAQNDLSGSAGNDTLTGGSFYDELRGNSGNDSLSGGAGGDQLYDDDNIDAPGNDTLLGGSGSDSLYSSSGADLIDGGTGSDYMSLSRLKTTLALNLSVAQTATAAGVTLADGTIIRSIESFTIWSGSGSDTLTGGAGNDGLNGYDGDDLLSGRAGLDFLYGGNGNDTLISGGGRSDYDGRGDYVSGDAGDDLVIATGQETSLSGGDGQDTLSFADAAGGIRLAMSGWQPNASGFERIIGTAYRDGIMGDSSSNWIEGGDGDDYLSGQDYNYGSTGSDTFYGGGGNDTVYMGATGYVDLGSGDDYLSAAGTLDNLVIIGGDGTDKLSVSNNLGTAVISGIEILETSGEFTATTSQFNGFQSIVTNYSWNLSFRLSGPGSVDFSTKLSQGANLFASNEGNGISGSAYAEQLTGGTGNDTLNGGGGNDYLAGGGGVDVLNGGAGDDTVYIRDNEDHLFFDGGDGADLVYASSYDNSANLGNATFVNVDRLYISGSGFTATVAQYNAFQSINSPYYGLRISDGGTVDFSTRLSQATSLYASALGNTITGTSFGEDINGGVGDDVLNGGAGNDYLTGSTGQNVLNGGTGDDRLYIGGVSDVVDGGDGIDTVVVGNNLNTLGSGSFTNVELLHVSGSGKSGTAAQFNSFTSIVAEIYESVMLILADAGAVDFTSKLSGSAYISASADGNFITAGAYNDMFYGKLGGDTLSGGEGADTIDGDAGGDVLDGGLGNDSLDGGAGNDTLSGGEGENYLNGGLGNDIYYLAPNSINRMYETSGGGVDTVYTSGVIGLGDVQIEIVFLTGSADVNATGNGLANSLTGNAGNNRLDGQGGADTLTGGGGDDTYVVNLASDVVIETAAAGNDLVRASSSFTLSDHVESLELTGKTNIDATGNNLANSLAGNTGNNVLDGGAGADVMTGGKGNDTYFVDHLGDTVVELTDQGTDSVFASVTYSLADKALEHLTLTGAAHLTATGNGLANRLTGNDGNNLLDGGAGNDTLSGGLGNDTYVLNTTSDVANEAAEAGVDLVRAAFTYTLGESFENLELTGMANLNGTGNALNNVLVGNDGKNVLNGRAGADRMAGGLGDDVYYVDNVGDNVQEQHLQGTDTIFSTVSYSLLGRAVEVLTLTGTGNLNGTGNSLANTITGTSGNNVLDGGTGADKLIGGLGDDTYYVDNVADRVVENHLEGTDTVFSSVTYSFFGRAAEILNLTGTGNIDGTGNSLANSLTGNGGNNRIDGAGGNDTLAGGSGADVFVFLAGSGKDRITDFTLADDDTINISAYSGGVINGGGVTIAQSGADALINLGGGNTILVLNTSAADPNFLGHITW